jgi:hypothetical protein
VQFGGECGLANPNITNKTKRTTFHNKDRLVWPVPLGPSVTTSSTDFSFQNLVFWNLFEFSAAEIALK